MDHEPGPVRGDCTVAFRREVALVQTILSALAPIVFTLLLGFVAAWRHDFGPKEASVLNRMVLWFNLLSRFLNGCRVPLETTDKIGTGTSPLENRTP
jgi:hypothetical protein